MFLETYLLQAFEKDTGLLKLPRPIVSAAMIIWYMENGWKYTTTMLVLSVCRYLSSPESILETMRV